MYHNVSTHGHQHLAFPSFSPFHETHHTTRCMRRLGLTIQLISITLDIIQSIRYDHCVFTQEPLNLAHLCCSCIFLFPSHVGVHAGWQPEGFIANDVNCKSSRGFIRRVVDAGLKVSCELVCAVGFAGAWVAGEKDEL